ncbi:MAG: RidA family protein [Comamonadaceae bacterium]|nr:MAG: RidA family protein [Comamonadaceae bacterium]
MASPTPVAQGAYVLARRHENTVFTAGMTPRENGVLLFSGKVRHDVDIGSLAEPVALATRNAVEAARSVLRGSEDFAQLLHMVVYIACEPDFSRHSAVADLASGYLRDRFGEAGVGARTAVGVACLPGDATVEIQLVLTVTEAN